MYVDKRLKGLHAVQTLSRLNRTHPPHKTETFVLDFANEAEDIQKAFEPYYERTSLTEASDPNLLYDLQTRMEGFHIFAAEDVESFAKSISIQKERKQNCSRHYSPRWIATRRRRRKTSPLSAQP